MHWSLPSEERFATPASRNGVKLLHPRERIYYCPKKAINKVSTYVLIKRQIGCQRRLADSDQAEKNRSVKNILLEKEGHDANSTTRFP